MVSRLPGFRFLGIAALLVGGTLWVACDVVGGGEESPGSIDYEIEFRLAEEHERAPAAPSVPTIFFTMRTNETFGCIGNEILHDVRRSAEHIEIRVTGIEAPEEGVCLPALGPATARRSLSLNAGTYTFELINGALRDEYTAAVTDRQIRVVLRSQQWTQSEDTLSWRYPRDSFAYYCTGPTEDVCTEFETRLEPLPLTSIEVPEQGVWPYNRGRRLELYLNAPGQFYRYPDEETWNEVEERLREFTCERDAAEIEVRNWLYDGVQSWMVDCGI